MHAPSTGRRAPIPTTPEGTLGIGFDHANIFGVEQAIAGTPAFTVEMGPGQLWLEQVATLDRKCQDDAELEWDSELGYRVVDAEGKELPYKDSDFGKAMDWGPH